jgi:hypothetical protein
MKLFPITKAREMLKYLLLNFIELLIFQQKLKAVNPQCDTIIGLRDLDLGDPSSG